MAGDKRLEPYPGPNGSVALDFPRLRDRLCVSGKILYESRLPESRNTPAPPWGEDGVDDS